MYDVGRRRTSSEDFELLRESSEMIVSSKIPAFLGKKSHAYISEKVGRHKILKKLYMCKTLKETSTQRFRLSLL